MQAGDLCRTLLGTGGLDRACIAAWIVTRFDALILPVADKSLDGLDNLFTRDLGRSAELSTMPLRRRPPGRCAASWITSETVSAGGQPQRHEPPFYSPLFGSSR